MKLKKIALLVTLLNIVVLTAFAAQPKIQPESDRYGDIDVLRPEIQIPNSIKPLFDYWMRDVYVCLGPDGYYYLTGTVKFPDKPDASKGSPGIPLWRSKDMKNWEDMGIVFDINKVGGWHSINDNGLTVWAPEIHYIKSQKTYFIVACNPYPPFKGSYVLRSTSGKPTGPYMDIKGNSGKSIHGQIDGSLFEDEDGTVYFLGHSHQIAKMKPDMSDIAEPFRDIIETPYKDEPYIEGIYMVKQGGKYHLIQSIWSFKRPDGTFAYDVDKIGKTFTTQKEKENARYGYDVVIATSDSPYGPFGKRYTSIIGGGHNNFFQDKKGNWYSTIFGNPRTNLLKKNFEARPAIVPLRIVDGKFYPDFIKADKF